MKGKKEEKEEQSARKKQEFRLSHLQPTQSPLLKYLDSIGCHTNHMLLLDVHHLKDGTSRYYRVFKKTGLSKNMSPPLYAVHVKSI